MMHIRRMAVLFSPLSLFFLLGGCGNPGSPLPPSLMLPHPVSDLSATRSADTVTLRWTMPRRTTDRVILKGDQRVVVCRAIAEGPCETLRVLLLAAGAPAQTADQLSPELRTGQARLLRYEVLLENHARRDAGPSNVAFAAAGWAPPSVLSVETQIVAQGIRVQWQAPAIDPAQAPVPGAALRVHLDRDQVPAVGEHEIPTSLAVQAGVPQPMQQALEAAQHPPAMSGGLEKSHSSWTPDFTLDASPAMNRSYRYSVFLVEQLTLDGHLLEIRGAPGVSAVVKAADLFPPAVPSDLAAVADADAGTIDLAWNSDAENDLAGYIVYRRVAGAAAPAERISGKTLLTTPDFRDSGVIKGMRYAYSVSAQDATGNESARSVEVIEALPQ